MKKQRARASDLGVSIQTEQGAKLRPMIRVEGSPGAGQYAFDEETDTYTFNAVDAGKLLKVEPRGRYPRVVMIYSLRQNSQTAGTRAKKPNRPRSVVDSAADS